MKKTIKTAMTAAMFAASLGAAANTASAAQTAEAGAAPNLASLVAATTGAVATVYGPPDVMESMFGEQTTDDEPIMLEGDIAIDDTTCTTATTELMPEGTVVVGTTTTPGTGDLQTEGVATIATTTELTLEGTVVMQTTTATVPVPVYGPPQVEIYGDIDYNRVLNAADLTMLKRILLEYGEDAAHAYEFDIDGDGIFDKEDIKALRRKLTGKSKEEEDAEEEAALTTSPLVGTNTTGTTTATTVQMVYGPPVWYD